MTLKLIITISTFLVFISMTTFAQTSYMDAYWSPNVLSSPISTTPKIFKTNVTSTVFVSISSTDIVNKVFLNQFGTNSNFRSGSSILTRIPLYIQPTFGQYRFPTGSGSNSYSWDGVASTDVTNMYATKIAPILGTKSSFLKQSQFGPFLTYTKVQANIVVNYFYARYGKTAVNNQVGATAAEIRTARVKQAVDYAAGFVRKMNIDLKAKVINWKIGNECYGNWEQGYNLTGLGDVTATKYGEDFKVFVAAMKAVDPTIKDGAVLVD